MADCILVKPCGVVIQNNTALFMARVIIATGDILQADITSLKYTIRDLTDDSPVVGHTDVALNKTLVVFDTLQTKADNALWKGGADGFNLAFSPDTTANEAFPNAETKYSVTVEITPVTGEPFELTPWVVLAAKSSI